VCAFPMRARLPLCVRALGSFKPLEAHICPLGAHLCPLGLFYVLWESFMLPAGQVRAPPIRAHPPRRARPPPH
jgi:hypothetical protein